MNTTRNSHITPPTAIASALKGEFPTRTDPLGNGKPGEINGSSVVPRPAAHALTDTLIKRVCIVAAVSLVPIACIVGAVAALVVGNFGLAIGGFTLSGMLATGAFAVTAELLWPAEDFQAPEGARAIRHDLATKSLRKLSRSYNFHDLAHYGYISETSAFKMSAMLENLEYPMPLQRGGWRIKNCYKRNLKAQFDELRKEKGFIQ